MPQDDKKKRDVVTAYLSSILGDVPLTAVRGKPEEVAQDVFAQLQSGKLGYVYPLFDINIPEVQYERPSKILGPIYAELARREREAIESQQKDLEKQRMMSLTEAVYQALGPVLYQALTGFDVGAPQQARAPFQRVEGLQDMLMKARAMLSSLPVKEQERLARLAEADMSVTNKEREQKAKAELEKQKLLAEQVGGLTKFASGVAGKEREYAARLGAEREKTRRAYVDKRLGLQSKLYDTYLRNIGRQKEALLKQLQNIDTELTTYQASPLYAPMAEALRRKRDEIANTLNALSQWEVYLAGGGQITEDHVKKLSDLLSIPAMTGGESAPAGEAAQPSSASEIIDRISSMPALTGVLADDVNVLTVVPENRFVLDKKGKFVITPRSIGAYLKKAYQQSRRANAEGDIASGIAKTTYDYLWQADKYLKEYGARLSEEARRTGDPYIAELVPKVAELRNTVNSLITQVDQNKIGDRGTARRWLEQVRETFEAAIPEGAEGPGVLDVLETPVPEESPQAYRNYPFETIPAESTNRNPVAQVPATPPLDETNIERLKKAIVEGETTTPTGRSVKEMLRAIEQLEKNM